jgi:transcriptional regulator with XRE-family HTH domain
MPGETPSRRRVTLECGRRIRALRTREQLTLEALGQRVHLTRGSLSKIENGKVDVPLQTLDRIAEALRVPLRTLFPEEAAAGSAEHLTAEIALLRDLLALYQREHILVIDAS